MGLVMSCSNADVVRLKAKQHPCVRKEEEKTFNLIHIQNLACFAGTHGYWEVKLPRCHHVELVWNQRGVQD